VALIFKTNLLKSSKCLEFDIWFVRFGWLIKWMCKWNGQTFNGAKPHDFLFKPQLPPCCVNLGEFIQTCNESSLVFSKNCQLKKANCKIQL